MRKNVKKISGVLLAAVVLLSGFVSVIKVLADPEPSAATVYGSGDKFLSFDLSDHDDFTVNEVTINGYSWTKGQLAEYHTSDNQYTIIVKITPKDSKVPTIGWGGNWNGFASITSNVKNGNQYTITVSVNNTNHYMDKQNPSDPDEPETFAGFFVGEENNQPGSQQGDEPAENFDGKAYVLWSCQGGGICMKHFNNIPSFDDGNSTFYKDTEIVDERTGEHFNINAKYKGWSTDARFNNWVEAYKAYKNIDDDDDIDWSTVNPKDMLGDPIDMRQYEKEAEDAGACTKEGKVQEEFQACVDQYVATKGIWGSRAQLQPVGEPNANNAYVSYGDRNFKVVIYNSNYKGITIGNLDDLQYYFNEWTNPFLRQDQYDISGTTKKKPTYITTVLFEKTVNIKTLDYNGFEITKLEALDVPSDAIEIKKVDGEWKITFSSSFYDNVVFKATNSNDEVSYFAIKRTTIDAFTPWIDNKPMYNADFYFEDTKSYKDFILTARLIFKDGSYKDVKLEAGKGIDDGLGNIDRVNYEVNGGKGLKKASFRYELTEEESRNIKKAYTNVELKGSTSTKFAGTYAGSGKGVLANIYDPEEDV